MELRWQKDIISDLRTPDRLRENLDIIDIVIAFLSSGGGKPDKPLGEYIKRVLKMDTKAFSSKVGFVSITTLNFESPELIQAQTESPSSCQSF